MQILLSSCDNKTQYENIPKWHKIILICMYDGIHVNLTCTLRDTQRYIHVWWWMGESTHSKILEERVYWCFTSHATIFQSYMWRHRYAGGLKKLYLHSGPQRHRHFAGFFNNVSVLHRHGTTLFIRWFRHTALISRLLRHDLGYGGRILDLNPGVLTGEILEEETRTDSCSETEDDDDDHELTSVLTYPQML